MMGKSFAETGNFFFAGIVKPKEKFNKEIVETMLDKRRPMAETLTIKKVLEGLGYFITTLNNCMIIQRPDTGENLVYGYTEEIGYE